MLGILAHTYLLATYQKETFKSRGTSRGGHRWSADDLRERFGGRGR
ncbi:hypothetical protein SAMN06265370_11394 [Puniceibacterium sediminis]|uniref:Uncharacterized protein n=1 Tax=Puniceibacterium sediminis TaxID=1608407 RepID=A0A238XYQ0_9RHOB|nr:hypothetical protein SAMN06265370_11394 [Puniceibacterium sediminis]